VRLHGTKDAPPVSPPAASLTVLRACAAYCLEDEAFPAFADWCARQPAASIFHAEDAEYLRDEVTKGEAMAQMMQRLAPMLGRLLGGRGGR
jgi:hypothetical protein